jgi:hypothetical protein
VAQKLRSVQSLHLAAEAKGIQPLLEISGAAPDDFGRSLSAFSLLLSLPGHDRVPVECAFQGSKVFERGGPYQDIYGLPPREAKTDSSTQPSR